MAYRLGVASAGKPTRALQKPYKAWQIMSSLVKGYVREQPPRTRKKTGACSSLLVIAKR